MNGGLTVEEMVERKRCAENMREALEWIDQLVKRPCQGIDGRVASFTEHLLVIRGKLTKGSEADPNRLDRWRKERGL
jgi:hypothetical protein